jgi:hypothetical protein
LAGKASGDISQKNTAIFVELTDGRVVGFSAACFLSWPWQQTNNGEKLSFGGILSQIFRGILSRMCGEIFRNYISYFDFFWFFMRQFAFSTSVLP